MNSVLERTAEKVVEKFITGDEAKELQRMTEYRVSHAMREGAAVSDQAFTWVDGDALCALSAGVAAAKARGWIKA